MASAAALSWFLVTSLTGLGILPAPTTPAEALVCVPKPASALEDLDYKKFSGDWREVLKSKHAPVLLQKGSWRFDFDTNTFAFSAALAGNETCLPAIVGKVHKVLPVGQFQLEYDFFGQPVQEACTLPSDEDPTLAEIPPGTGICFLERKEGFCANKQTVFYYDREQRSCLNFTFTGCGANENHFLTRQECVERCEKPLEQARAPPVESESAQCPQRAACGLACAHCCQRREKDSCIACNCLASETGACKLPVKEGNCNERIPRYFFNVTSGVCDVFYYTGCGGNENSFASHEECIAQCEDPCRLPMDPGSCNDTQERYYFNSQTGLCETFEYGGCEGNKNNFADLDACKTLCEDVCSQPQDPGPCYAYFRRFYYNKQEDRCLPFIFGGCMGNGNNFYTSTQCNGRCRLHVAEDGAAGKDRVHVAEDGVAGKDREMCHQPVDEGHCDTDSSGPGATTPEVRFYYDVQKELCERFNYQGCGGNDNNFRTVDGCNMTCFGVRINLARTAASCPESMQCSCGDEQEAKCGSCECGNAAPRSNGAALYALVFLTGASVTASLCTL
ncbi:papilin-like isoform X13 [Amblyomma americanum]